MRIRPINSNGKRYLVDFKSKSIDFAGLLWLIEPFELSIGKSKNSDAISARNIGARLGWKNLCSRTA